MNFGVPPKTMPATRPPKKSRLSARASLKAPRPAHPRCSQKSRLKLHAAGNAIASQLGGYQMPESGSAAKGMPESWVGFQRGISPQDWIA